MRPLEQNAGMARTRFQGRKRGRGGGGPSRGQGKLIYYNCKGLGHYACDCTNPTRLSCKYCTLFDLEMEDCPMLIARICDKGVLPPQPTQNLQMMRYEPCEEDPNVNIVLRSGSATWHDKGKQPEDNTWVRKAPVKEVEFDLEGARETFMEAKKSFIEASTLGGKDKPDQEMDPSMLTTFLETCMKLIRNSKVLKGLQELINRCTRNTSSELCIVRKIGKHKTRTGREMRLTT